MPLTVLNIGYSLAPVGPEVAGGAEQILSALDHALVAAGHRSIVVAPQGSRTAGTLVATMPLPSPLTDAVRAAVQQRQRDAIALALGRICPEKGFHLALNAAALAGVPLLIAGQVFPYPYHQRYFDEEIRPRLGPSARFVGKVGFARKRRLLSAARCLLVPSLVAETGSLVAMEALACGTPVVAFPAGALADIIEPGVTGFLVKGAQDMAGAIAAAGTIDPERCREAARARFPPGRMVERYLAVYERFAATAPATV